MREYDDQVRPYVVLRRIIIVVAVLTAVPVALWTVTEFVRTYVDRRRFPRFARLRPTQPSHKTAPARPALPAIGRYGRPSPPL